MSHQVPSRSPPLNQPSLTALQDVHLPLFQKTPHLSLHLLFKAYVPKYETWGRRGPDPQPPTLSYQWAGPQRDRPRRNSHLTHSPHEPSHPSEANFRVSDGPNPHPWEPRPGYRRHKARAAPAAATRPGRVTSSPNTESIVDTGRWCRW